MIDAVVNTSADYVAKTRIQPAPQAVVNATTTTTNTKTTKAIEVQSQANAVNGKDLIEKEVIKKEKQNSAASIKEAFAEQRSDEIEAELASLTDNMNFMVKNYGLSFDQAKDLNKTVVTVRDTTTDEVIRQIPSEDFLKIARYINSIKEEGAITNSDLQGLFVNKQV
jgi:flagellar protein FlaG